MLQKKLEDIRRSYGSHSQEEITVLLDLAEILNKTNTDEACNLADQALSIAQELGLEIYCARCYKIKGISYSYRGEYEKALDFSLKSLAVYEDIDDKTAISSTLNTIGNKIGRAHV